ncbi:MAG: YqjK family protein [Sterolibacterium sp.]|nr:YqjK family protein [Sterolibacterium sp.]
MSPKQVELALKKQYLQMRSASLRETFADYASGWTPVFAVADRAYAGWIWLRRHPVLPVAVLVALVVSRPRAVLRWIRRGFLIRQALHKLSGVIAVKLPGRH